MKELTAWEQEQKEFSDKKEQSLLEEKIRMEKEEKISGLLLRAELKVEKLWDTLSETKYAGMLAASTSSKKVQNACKAEVVAVEAKIAATKLLIIAAQERLESLTKTF